MVQKPIRVRSKGTRRHEVIRTGVSGGQISTVHPHQMEFARTTGEPWKADRDVMKMLPDISRPGKRKMSVSASFQRFTAATWARQRDGAGGVEHGWSRNFWDHRVHGVGARRR